MKRINGLILSTITASFLTGCGGGGSTDGSTSYTSSLKSLSGTIVDGYIKDATVCVDLNINGNCDVGEPTAISDENGNFKFSNLSLTANQLYPVISIGGVDTATRKVFEGELKNVFDSNTINSGKPLNVSPLTDLVATSFLQSSTKDAAALTTSKTTIATALGLDLAKIDKDPMQDSEVFAKAQEIQQIKELIKTTSQKNSTSALTDDNQNTITKALVNQLSQDSTLDIQKVLTKVEAELSITIPSNEKTFISEQSNEIKTKLSALVNNTTLDITKLDEIQNALETQVDNAHQVINNAIASDILIKVTIPDINTLITQGETLATNSAPYFLDGITKITTKSATINENSSLDLSILAKDDNNNTLTYSLGGLDKTHFIYNSVTSKLSSISFDYENPEDANSDNTYNLQLIANDGKESAYLNLIIKVNNIDDNTPTMSTISNITLNKNASEHIITLDAKDLDGTTVSYTMATQYADDLYTLKLESNLLKITPITNKYGTDTISITASSNGKSITKAFNLTIKDTGALVIPTNTILPRPPMMPTLQGN